MTPYLDAGFLLTILVQTKGSAISQQLLRERAPFRINSLHQLQAENLLQTLKDSDEPARQAIGADGDRLWKNYLEEGVFQLLQPEWEPAYRLAIIFNARHRSPPPPLLLLHPALAVVERATDFLSFDPRSRALAKAVGLKLQPSTI
jgi:hypothetical protein